MLAETKVIDASALAALVFGEPEAAKVVACLGNSQLVAPALLSFELASVCLKKLRRHPDQRELILTSYHLATRIEINEASVDFNEVLALAESTALTTYDASYLWLARQLGAEIVTLDQRLAQVASAPP